jgi:hypothetical protein
VVNTYLIFEEQMMKKINVEWLEENITDCSNDLFEFVENVSNDVKTICNWLFAGGKANLASWIVGKCISDPISERKFSLYCTMKILEVYKEEFINNTTFDKVIRTIKKYNKRPIEKNKQKLRIIADEVYDSFFEINPAVAVILIDCYDQNNYAAGDTALAAVCGVDSLKEKIQIVNYGLNLLYK